MKSYIFFSMDLKFFAFTRQKVEIFLFDLKINIFEGFIYNICWISNYRVSTKKGRLLSVQIEHPPARPSSQDKLSILIMFFFSHSYYEFYHLHLLHVCRSKDFYFDMKIKMILSVLKHYSYCCERKIVGTLICKHKNTWHLHTFTLNTFT